jgi:hypothetical protein
MIMKKITAFITTILCFSLPIQSIAGGIPLKHPGGDEIQFGKPESSDPKVIEFNTGDSPNNVKMSVNDGTRAVTVNSPDSISLKSDTVNVGDGTAADQDVNFDIGAGASNPKIGYNNGTSSIEFCNDGVTCKKIGSGAGGGAGLNMLADFNADMEAGTQNWTASGGALAEETTDVANGVKSLSWNPSATSQTLDSQAVTIDQDSFAVLRGDSCSSVIYYLWPAGSSGDIQLKAIKGASTLLGEALDLKPTEAGTWRRAEVTYPCPFNDTLKLRLESTTDAAVIKLDDAFQGRFELFDLSQSGLAGTSFYPQTTNCTWARTNTALGAFPTDSDCPGPTVNGSIGIWQTTDDDLPTQTINNLPAGKYVVRASVPTGGSNADAITSWALSDDGCSTFKGGGYDRDDGANQREQINLEGVFTYTTAGNHTFEICAAASAGPASILNADTTVRNILEWTIIYYPLASTQAVKLEQTGTLKDWIPYTPTGTWTTNTTYSGQWQRVGDDMHGRIKVSTSGAPTAGNLYVDIPAGYTIDTTKLEESAVFSATHLGRGIAEDTGVENYPVYVGRFDGNSVFPQAERVDGTWNKVKAVTPTQPFTFGAGDSIEFEFRVPIVGWGDAAQYPVPLLVKSMVTPFAGVTKVGIASIEATSGTPSVNYEHGDWINDFVDEGVGDWTVNFVSGTFTGTVTCVCTAVTSGTNNRSCGLEGYPSTSSVRVKRWVDSSSAAEDGDVTLTCWGSN